MSSLDEWTSGKHNKIRPNYNKYQFGIYMHSTTKVCDMYTLKPDLLLLTQPHWDSNQGNLILKKVSASITKLKKQLGDQRAYSLTSIEVCSLLYWTKMLHITKMSTYRSPNLFSSYMIIPLYKIYLFKPKTFIFENCFTYWVSDCLRRKANIFIK